MVRKVTDREDSRDLRWFGHMGQMDDGRFGKGVIKAKVSPHRPRGRPNFGRIDGVNQALVRKRHQCECSKRACNGCVLTRPRCAFPSL